jgi:hypothetical protein
VRVTNSIVQGATAKAVPGGGQRRRCSDVVTERITMLPMKGVLDESLALDLVMCRPSINLTTRDNQDDKFLMG